jgi:hypothetical protein
MNAQAMMLKKTKMVVLKILLKLLYSSMEKTALKSQLVMIILGTQALLKLLRSYLAQKINIPLLLIRLTSLLVAQALF